jgi:membrane-associated phospholipid phosphatase
MTSQMKIGFFDRILPLEEVHMKRRATLISLFTVVFGTAAAVRADEVTDWEHIFLSATVTAGTAPYVVTRYAAILHAAVFDAVNGVNPKYAPVHVAPTAPPGASARAAAVMAAYTALINIYPAQKATFDAALPGSLAGIASGPAAEHSVAIQRGMAWGQSVATQVLAFRANDGANAILPPYIGSSGPGQWRPTPPAFASGVGQAYATVTPWVLTAPSQFRPGPPPDLTSQTYTADFNETKTMGDINSATRSAEETLYAQFWQNSTVTWFWERVAISLSDEHNYTLGDNAHLLAVLSLAMADATIATFDAKYTYSFWRPVTAIRAADTDGNPATDVDPTWTPLIVTPAHPEYPSAHSIISSAATAVLANFFGENTSFTVDSSSMAGVTRSFTSFSAATAEIKNARVFGGIHFRNSCNVGQAVGDAVGTYVIERALLREPGIH